MTYQRTAAGNRYRAWFWIGYTVFVAAGITLLAVRLWTR